MEGLLDTIANMFKGVDSIYLDYSAKMCLALAVSLMAALILSKKPSRRTLENTSENPPKTSSRKGLLFAIVVLVIFGISLSIALNRFEKPDPEPPEPPLADTIKPAVDTTDSVADTTDTPVELVPQEVDTDTPFQPGPDSLSPPTPVYQPKVFHTIILNAEQEPLPTKLGVHEGDSIRIGATNGLWLWDDVADAEGVGPEGSRGIAIELEDGKSFPLPLSPCGGLMARIGNSGSWRFVGRDHKWIAEKTGTLMLGVNNSNSRRETDMGHFDVHISIQRLVKDNMEVGK